MNTSVSLSTEDNISGLSGKPCEVGLSTGDNLKESTEVNTLSELDDAITKISQCMALVRGRSEAAQRRRELLDTCVRANLCEMPDGQFTQMKDDKDRCQMLASIMQADHEFADANMVFHIAFTKTLNALRRIGEENTVITLWTNRN
jgi:hypothetical protein